MENQEQEAPAPEYSEDGVDLSLIRWMLSLTPAERLDVLQNHPRNTGPLLRELSVGGVEFIAAGGFAQRWHCPWGTTIELSVVPSSDAANLNRLLAVLGSLDARYRLQPDLRPTFSHLTRARELNLTTRYGPLDVLGTIGRGRTYEDLLPHTVEMEIGGGVRVRVLDLETLIAVKEEVGGKLERR